MREQQEFSLLRVRPFITSNKFMGTELKEIYIKIRNCRFKVESEWLRIEELIFESLAWL